MKKILHFYDLLNQLVLICPDSKKCLYWLAVCGSQNIDYSHKREANSDLIVIPGYQALRALEQIRRFEGEKDLAKKSFNTQVKDLAFSSLIFFSSIAVVLFHRFVSVSDIAFVEKGLADNHRILDGELYRCLTALTLHSGWQHVSSNIIALFFFMIAMSSYYRPALSIFLVLLTGTLGNLVNAWNYAPDLHRSLGASTAVFAALGILGSARFVDRFLQKEKTPIRVFRPLIAVLAYFSISALGDIKTDVMAHVFGLIVGLTIGLGHRFFCRIGDSRFVQFFCAVASFLAIYFSWFLALNS